MTSGFPLLDQAHDALRTVTAGASDLLATTPCDLWNVTQVIQHAAGDQIAYASFLTGGPGPDFDPFNPDGNLAVPAAEMIEDAVSRSAAAFASIDPEAAEVPTPIPPNKMPARQAAAAAAMDAAVHAWDIAKATGQPSPLTDELAAALLPTAKALVEPLRAWGAFAPAVPGTPADSPAADLLHYLGRRP
ncbi:TIGR03086 family metal-binding protein [Actinocorallia longicatena]|uniref:Mycothiol-dependent maleylpyruvate isomerase metal-binding domain-containing protein n=1 Tax=Actinocorallia longicatena TaxID=111803 RepID=A0ABP6QBU7_9ACTN